MKFPSLVAAILQQPCFRAHVTLKTQLTPDSGPCPEHYELPMEKKVPWNGAVSMRSRTGSWETL